MKKIKMSREFAYFFGIISMAFSVAISAKANLGLSMIVSPAYILSQKISFLTFGQAEYIIQFILVVLICVIIGKIRLSFAFSFVTAVFYGAVLDLFTYLIRNMDVSEMYLRVIFFAAGMVITAMSVSLLFNTYLSPCAYDFFVSKIAKEKELNLKKFKLAFDFSFLVIAIVMSFILFKKLVGVSVGTVVIALLNGHIIGFFSKLEEKHIEFFDRFPLAKYFEK